MLHPFRDVKTRSQFVFFNQLARTAGWVIDWDQIDPQVFAHARTVAIARSEAGIDVLLRPSLRTVAEIERHDELRQKRRNAEAAFFAPRPRRTRSQLDKDLRRALERRSGR